MTDTSDLTVIRFNQVIKVWTNMSVCLHGTPCHIQPHLHLTIIFLLSQVRLCNTARKHTSVLSTLLFMKPWLLIFYRIKAPGMSTACMHVCLLLVVDFLWEHGSCSPKEMNTLLRYSIITRSQSFCWLVGNTLE